MAQPDEEEVLPCTLSTRLHIKREDDHKNIFPICLGRLGGHLNQAVHGFMVAEIENATFEEVHADTEFRSRPKKYCQGYEVSSYIFL